jgi:hypothetical protein
VLDFEISWMPDPEEAKAMLSPLVPVFGLYMPVEFRIYKTFESAANDKYELTLAYPKYR